MVDESNRVAGGRDKTPRMATATSTKPTTTPATTDCGATNTNTNTKQRRRRSIFAVLFNQSRSTNKSAEELDASAGSRDNDKQQVQKNNNAKSKSDFSNNNNSIDLAASLKSEILKSDIVLIRPNEAKCIEATIKSAIGADDLDSSHGASTRNNNNNNTDKSRGKRIVLSRCDSENATKSISRNSPSHDKQHHHHNQQQQQQNHPIKLMKRKIRGKLKRRDEDADSYVLDLNDRMEAEKLRISSSSSSSSSRSSSSSSSCSSEAEIESTTTTGAGFRQNKSPSVKSDIKSTVLDGGQHDPLGRETSPIDDLWRTNENYVPCARTSATGAPARVAPPKQPSLSANKLMVKRRQRSPMLEEFLRLHQIQLSERRHSHHHHHKQLNSSSELDIDDEDGDSYSRSSCDSLSCCRAASSQLPPYRQVEFDRLDPIGRPASGGAGAEIMSESDRRLYHWRKLAERSVTMWQVPADSSTEDSDDELELVNCQSPALVCYCSDDTSCSSVELIWSRPQLQARQQQRQQHQQQHQPAGLRELRSTSRQFTETVTHQNHRPAELRQRVAPSYNLATPNNNININKSPVSRLASSVSPARSKLSEDSISFKGSPSPVSGADASRPLLAPKSSQNLMLPRGSTNHYDNCCNSNYSSLSVSDNGSNHRNSWRQKPAILELAKPCRARDRRIGERTSKGAHRSDRRTGASLANDLGTSGQAVVVAQAPVVPAKPRLSLQRNSIDCSNGLARDIQEQGRSSSRMSTSSSSWVANPLFGRTSGNNNNECDPQETDRLPMVVGESGSSIKNKDNRLKAGAKSMDSTESSAATSRPLRRGLSVDLLNQQPAPPAPDASSGRAHDNEAASKSSRFKSFLARIKKLDPKGSTNLLSSSSLSIAMDDTDSKPSPPVESIEKPQVKGGDSTAQKIKLADDFANTESHDNFSLHESTGFDANERHKRHRWSLRMRSPFIGGGGGGGASAADTTKPTDNSAYLGRHLVNLDRRFKSNVSSLKSHLTDTGKRASVLADQLLTSIKDTTKEQLLAATTGTSARDRYDTLPNSFASKQTGSPAALDFDASQKRQPYHTSTSGSSSKARQFALIYMHQQAQATGQPVITRQPAATGASHVQVSNRRRSIDGRAEFRPISLSTQSIANQPAIELTTPIKPKIHEQQEAEISMEQIMDECMRRSGQAADMKDEATGSGPDLGDCSEKKVRDKVEENSIVKEEQVRLPEDVFSCTANNCHSSIPSAGIGLGAPVVEYCQTIGAGQRGREIELRTRGVALKKRLRPRKARRQINVAPESDDDGGDTSGVVRQASGRVGTGNGVGRGAAGPLSSRQYFKTRSRPGLIAQNRQNVTY